MKVRLSDLRRIIREEVEAIVGAQRGPDIEHLKQRVRGAAERVAHPGTPPESIARDFYSLVQYEIPGVNRDAAVAKFSAAADSVLRGTEEPGMRNLQYTLGRDAGSRKDAVRPALISALIDAFDGLGGTLKEGLGKMKGGTIDDLKSVEPRFHAYIAAKYRDELGSLKVAFESSGVFSKKKYYVYVPGKSTNLQGRQISSPSNDLVVSWVDGRPSHSASATLIDAVRSATGG